MLTFKFFLNEARRNANLKAQERLNALDALEKWSSSPDIHISYTAIRKIGVNPKSKFIDTPLAVYAYPLKEVWDDIKNEGVRNVRFAANTSKFIFVLRERGQKLKDVSDYRKSDLDADLKKIRTIVGDAVYNDALSGFKEYPLPYQNLQHFVYTVALKTGKKTTAGYSAVISNILLKLGYVGFSDRKGTGQIHPAEETQSYFLAPKAYEVVDVIEIKNIDVKDERVRDMADYLKKNASRLSDDEIIDIVSKDFSLAKYMGPPRTEVLKFFIDKKQAERWKSKQTRNDDPDDDSKDYVPAENSMHGTQMLYNYNKLPEDLLSWLVSHPNLMVSSGVINWMKHKKYKPTDDFVANNIKHNEGLIELVPSISKKVAKEVVKHHGYKYTIGTLASKMSESDLFDVLDDIRDFDPMQISSYYEPVAKYLYNKIINKRNPSSDDINIVAFYIQKAHRNPPMDMINGLKSTFPNHDFTEVGGWAFWKR